MLAKHYGTTSLMLLFLLFLSLTVFLVSHYSIMAKYSKTQKLKHFSRRYYGVLEEKCCQEKRTDRFDGFSENGPDM